MSFRASSRRCTLLGLAAAVLVTGLEGLGRARAVFNGPVSVPGAPPGAAPRRAKGGLHIPQGRSVNFTYTLNDGAGYRWDLQYYGTVGQGR